MRKFSLTFTLLILIGLVSLSLSALAGGKSNGFNSYDWTEVNQGAPWVARAGLEAVVLDAHDVGMPADHVWRHAVHPPLAHAYGRRS